MMYTQLIRQMLNCCSWFILICLSINYVLASSYLKYRWGQWSSTPLTCSVTCGNGVRCRVRSCLDGYGNVQSSTMMCESSDPYESQAKECMPCFVNTRCPRIPGWGTWSSWSSCLPTGGQKINGQGCHTGIRTRYRLCNNPPPEPYGFNCSGISHQTTECDYNCVDEAFSTLDDIADKITFQVAKDQLNMNAYQNILRMRVKQSVRMDCVTPAYNLAKKLTSRGIFGLTSRLFQEHTLTIKWLKNGRSIIPADSNSGSISERIYRTKNFKNNQNELFDEEMKWNLLPEISSFYMEDTYLVFPSIDYYDQGFYTCQMTIGNHKWNTIFYTLIITGIKYIALEGDPFYLYSNLGYFNALDNTAVWMESAQIVWKLNGYEYSRNLALRLNRRIQLIPYLNLTHHGTWKCFLFLQAYRLPSQVDNPRTFINRIYLINEFYLKVYSTQPSLWQSIKYPITARALKQTTVILLTIGLFLTLIILLNIWAARRWIKRTLTSDQQKAIIQELLDNECRLLLACKKRANINKNRLLPLILQEDQRLRKASRILGLDNKQQIKIACYQ
ncbi:unnamed protein product [Schistosoma rodhaini]|nr:unnamed protein product [Schistosoma rodhaini]